MIRARDYTDPGSCCLIGNCVSMKQNAPCGSHCGGAEESALRPAAGEESCEQDSFYIVIKI